MSRRSVLTKTALPWMGVEENLVTRTVCPRKRQVPSSLLVNLLKDVPHYYSNVVGLPLPALAMLLRRFGVDVWKSARA